MSVEGQPITVLSVYTSFAWIQPVGGSNFTKAQADTLYLRKTIPDTATALETFNQGILVENTADFNGNVNVYQNPLTLKDNAISPSSTITLSPITPGPYINITSFSNQVELLTGMLSFNNDGSVQVGATKNLTLGTIDANVSLGSVGKATTLNGTITVNGTINNYARLNASQAFSASQAFTGGVYNIFASTIGGNVGQTTQSLFANTANSNIALGSSSTVNLDGTLQVTSGTTQVKFNINGVNQDDNYSNPSSGDSSNLTPSILTFYDKGLALQTDITNVNLTMDSNVLGSTGYKTEILNDKTQANITFLNKSNGTNVVVRHSGIVATVGANSTTIGVGSITTTDALSIQAGNTGIINFGTSGSRTAAMNIGTGMTSGNITMGAGTSVTVVNGSGIKFDTLSTNNPTSTQNLYSNKTGGVLGIGTGMASGDINCFHTTSTAVFNVRGQGGIVTTGTIKMQNDLDTSLIFQRNGAFNIGIDAGATPKLILGVATGGNEVKINSLGTGTVYSNAGVLTNTNPSDETLKKNIVSIDVSIDNLNPVKYEWIDEKMGTGVKYGFLANEVVEIFPDICSTWKTDEEEVKLGMDTVSLIPIMVSAMKKMKLEYDTKISKLEERLLALENRIA